MANSFSLEIMAKIAAEAAKRAKPVKQAKATQAKSYASKKRGTCKPLPISPFTPKASDSRWAILAKGTEDSAARNLEKYDCRPKASLGDRRLMGDFACVSTEDKLYKVPKGVTNVELCAELLRIKLVRYMREHELGQMPLMSSKEHQNLRRALAKGDMHNVTKIIQRNVINNQIKLG